MTTLEDFADLGRQEQGLAVISTVRADGSVQASLVNSGVMPHPITTEPCLAPPASRRHPALSSA